MFRALDSLGLAQSLPAALRRLMDLDADCAEALWVLSRSRGRHDLAAMERDTRASLAKLPAARAAVAALFSADEQALLDRRVELVRMTLSDADAYDDLPSTRPRR